MALLFTARENTKLLISHTFLSSMPCLPLSIKLRWWDAVCSKAGDGGRRLITLSYNDSLVRLIFLSNLTILTTGTSAHFSLNALGFYPPDLYRRFRSLAISSSWILMMGLIQSSVIRIVTFSWTMQLGTLSQWAIALIVRITFSRS